MRTLRQSPWFLGLLCLLLIGARISGAHWHLCYDGQEPPIEIHVGDAALGDGNDHPGYEDADLNLVDDGITKILSAGLDMAMLFAFFVLLWRLPNHARSVPTSQYRVPLFPTDPRLLLAPPRAPPL